MNMKTPAELYVIAEPEAAAAPADIPISDRVPAATPIVQREHSWRDLMQRMEKKQRQECG